METTHGGFYCRWVDMVECEDEISVIFGGGKAGGFLVGHESHVQSLSELKAFACGLQLVHDFIPDFFTCCHKVVVPEVDAGASGGKELGDVCVPLYAVVVAVHTEWAFTEASASSEADACKLVIIPVAVWVGCYVFIVEVIVRHVVLDLVREDRPTDLEESCAADGCFA